MEERRPALRMASVLAVARTLLLTLDAEQAVEVLVAEFGWDTAFQALALLRGDEAAEAFGIAWEQLLGSPPPGPDPASHV